MEKDLLFNEEHFLIQHAGLCNRLALLATGDTRKIDEDRNSHAPLSLFRPEEEPLQILCISSGEPKAPNIIPFPDIFHPPPLRMKFDPD